VFGALNAKQLEYLQDIRQSGAHVVALMEDLLDLSRIEAGQLAMSMEWLDVAAIMDSAAAMVRGLVNAHGPDLRVEHPPRSVLIWADERRLRQVACNLLGNAVKFAPPRGRVTFRAWRSDGEVVFLVEDNGPGIAPEFHGRIFEQFFRLPSHAEGAGLGLPLARQLVELHGGRIWVDSAEGQGGRFYFALPTLDGSKPNDASSSSVEGSQVPKR
jgi:signal transduction histidine kinase